ncbi:Protein DGCR6, partial [Eschrichtius robustus]|nr:Protein DGCR6 [Eschrichtius robustus]
MERYSGALEEAVDGARQQERHYQLLSALQGLVKELPSIRVMLASQDELAVEHRIREEQRAMDQKIVLELDRKVADQQSTLEKAGVAGFYVTTNPQELTLQMNLLELIRKLQQRGCQVGKAAL